jgi:probable addiction module antidote protein
MAVQPDTAAATAANELKLNRWGGVEQLKTDESIALYLDACIDEDPGDGSRIRAALGDVARAKGMSQLARDTGLAREGLYKALSAEGNPEFSTIMKVMRALGVKLHVEAP